MRCPTASARSRTTASPALRPGFETHRPQTRKDAHGLTRSRLFLVVRIERRQVGDAFRKERLQTSPQPGQARQHRRTVLRADLAVIKEKLRNDHARIDRIAGRKDHGRRGAEGVEIQVEAKRAAAAGRSEEPGETELRPNPAEHCVAVDAKPRRTVRFALGPQAHILPLAEPLRLRTVHTKLVALRVDLRHEVGILFEILLDVAEGLDRPGGPLPGDRIGEALDDRDVAPLLSLLNLHAGRAHAVLPSVLPPL